MNGVIYCRVSSKEQVKGTSLESQELACREYAGKNNVTILRVFVEEGESAKFADRPQLLELLAFCRERKHDIQALLVWKVDRLARNVGDHYNIKASLSKQDIRVISVTEPIDANPEGKLLETILAGFAQFDNDLRAARTLQGMRRKMQEGLFPWKPPFGYKTVTQPGEKKTKPDVPDQPLFRLLQRAWEHFATGAYTNVEILRLMKSWGIRTAKGAPLSKQSLNNMLRDPFYAGIIRNPWGDEEFQGRHIPMVSRETFIVLQEIMDGRSKHRTVLRPELPLRMFARCTDCERPLTGGLSRGRSHYYPYYRCFNAVCGRPGNYRAETVHDEFANFLTSITPDMKTLTKLSDALMRMAENRAAISNALATQRHQQHERLEHQQQQLIQMKFDGLLTNDEFMTQKTRIARQLRELDAQGEIGWMDERQLTSLIDKVSAPLTRLPATWIDMPLAFKPRFQKTILPDGFAVGRIRTAQTSCLFSTFYQLENQIPADVPPEGQFWNRLTRELQEFVELFRIVRGEEAA